MRFLARTVRWGAVLICLPAWAEATGFSISGATVTLAAPAVLSTPGDVTLAAGSLIANGAQLNVGGNWAQSGGTFDGGTSTVTIQGAATSTSTFSGSSTFYSLQCVTPGKGLTFASGSTQTVTGALILSGAAGNRIRLRASTPGAYAYLVNSGTNTVSLISAQDNNAAGGLAIRAGSASFNGGHNVNWSFGEPAPSAPASAAVYASSMTVLWGAVNSINGYSLEASTASDFSGTIFSSVTLDPAATGLTVGAATPLAPDTTYYVRSGALYNGTTSYASMVPVSTATLTDPVGGAQYAQVWVTSVSVNWAALGAAQGYELDASTSPTFQPLAGSSVTAGVSVTTLTVSNLAAFTTYYFRVGGINWNHRVNTVSLPAVQTIPGGPPGTPALSAVFVTSASVAWTTAAHSTGYEVDASTAGDFTGTLFSSITINPAATALTVGRLPPLAADTTYYMRVGALYNGATIYAAGIASTATLTSSITPLQIAAVSVTSVTVNWVPLNSAQGYELDASTSPTFTPLAGSSSTTDVALSTLTVEGLSGNVSYFLRVGGLNWNAVPNFAFAGAATAGVGAAPLNPVVSEVSSGSITTAWETVPGATGYVVDVSTDDGFAGTLFSSVSVSPTAVALTVGAAPSLAADTTYYVRAGALYGGATSYTTPLPASLATLTMPIAGARFSGVFATSITVNWIALDRAQGYVLEASTSSDFSELSVSSATDEVLQSTLTLEGLTAGTTYFLRVGGLNWNAVVTAVDVGAARTTAGPPPLNPTAGTVLVTSLTVTWGSVHADNGYSLEASTASDFSGHLFSSATADGDAGSLELSGLGANTLYYLRVGSLWNGTTAYAATVPATVVTLAVLTVGTPAPPAEITGAFAGLGGNFILSWRAVTLNTNGDPTPVGYYVVERSADFLGPYHGIAAVSVSTLSYTDVTHNQTFYYRVRAADVNNNLSQPSDVLDSSPDINRYIASAEDPLTHLTIPATISGELLAENNGIGDVMIRPIHQSANEQGAVLFSYQFAASKVATGETIPNFAFSKTAMTVQMHYEGVIDGAPHFGARELPIGTPVTLYWLNGALSLPLAGSLAVSNQPFSVLTRNTGVYQLRVGGQEGGGQFQLLPGSPYPRILTPHRVNENRRLFFFFSNPSGQPVMGTIYDLRGARVRDLSSDASTPTANSLVWDGTNSEGHIVPGGMYLYKLTCGSRVITGSVAVAR